MADDPSTTGAVVLDTKYSSSSTFNPLALALSGVLYKNEDRSSTVVRGGERRFNCLGGGDSQKLMTLWWESSSHHKLTYVKNANIHWRSNKIIFPSRGWLGCYPRPPTPMVHLLHFFRCFEKWLLKQYDVFVLSDENIRA